MTLADVPLSSPDEPQTDQRNDQWVEQVAAQLAAKMVPRVAKLSTSPALWVLIYMSPMVDQGKHGVTWYLADIEASSLIEAERCCAEAHMTFERQFRTTAPIHLSRRVWVKQGGVLDPGVRLALLRAAT